MKSLPIWVPSHATGRAKYSFAWCIALLELAQYSNQKCNVDGNMVVMQYMIQMVQKHCQQSQLVSIGCGAVPMRMKSTVQT